MGLAGRPIGEDEARRIVERHYADVLAYCARHTVSAEEAADAAQETFLRFVRAVPTYRDRGKPLAFLLTIARNVCVDLGRSHLRDTDELPDELPDDRLDEASSTELSLVLESLPRELQEALDLRFGQGLRVGEVARALGVSRFAAARRINAGLDLLRAGLGAAPEGGRR